MNMQRIQVEAFDQTWICHAYTFEDCAVLISVEIGGVMFGGELLNPRVKKVLEMDCWAARQKAAA